MANPPKPPQPPKPAAKPSDDKAARRAAALKANLKRRKAGKGEKE